MKFHVIIVKSYLKIQIFHNVFPHLKYVEDHASHMEYEEPLLCSKVI